MMTLTKIAPAQDAETVSEALRHCYYALSDDDEARLAELRSIGAAFIEKCDEIGSGDRLNSAKKTMEQALLWADRHFTD